MENLVGPLDPPPRSRLNRKVFVFPGVSPTVQCILLNSVKVVDRPQLNPPAESENWISTEDSWPTPVA